MKSYTKKWRITSEKGRANNNINWKKNKGDRANEKFYSNISSLIFRKKILNTYNQNKQYN